MRKCVRATAFGVTATLLSAAAFAQSPVAVDTPLTTANGTALVAPRGWSVTREAAAIRLGAPEGGVVVFTDTVGGDADAAVAAAWRVYRNGAAPEPTRVRDRPPRDGWEQIRGYSYASPAGPSRTVSARALRKGNRWTVVLLDLEEAVIDKRDSQLEVMLGPLAPAGYQRESFAGRAAHRISPSRLRALTDLIEVGRAGLDIPGIGFGLIQDGEVIAAQGFGVRQLGRPELVDADTRFMIGSNNKALTTLMLAKLVEAKKFDWDTPVATLWPAFRLGDAATTAKVRVRHLVCACTGLPRQDYPWIFQGDVSSPATVLTWLSTMQPTSEFGELYQYSNLLAGSAGYLGAHVIDPTGELGATYDSAMQRLVFDPLGMTGTTFDSAAALAGNHAAPHALDIDGRQQVAAMGINDAGRPSRPDGAAWSSVNDMLKYVSMELASGKLPDGRRYIAEAPLLARRAPQVAEGSNEFYAMGLKIDRIWGVPVIHHGGSMAGARSDMIWLPEHGVGAVILTNADSGSSLRAAFRRRLLEVLFDGEARAEASLAGDIQSFKASRGEAREELTVPGEPAAFARLASAYRNADLGDLNVRRDGARIIFDTGGWASEVATRRDEDGTITFVTISPGTEGFEFELAAAGQGLVVREAPIVYVFTPVH